MRDFEINSDARRTVEERSRWVSEGCREAMATHMHHLTYERAGNELPEDLLHLCIRCHMGAHPQKAEPILSWEVNRIARARQQEDVRRQRREDEEDRKTE